MGIRRWIQAGALLLTLGLAPIAAAWGESPRPISGVVTAFNSTTGTLELGATLFSVPPQVEGLEDVSPGLTVLVYYETAGSLRQVTRIEIARPE